MLVLALGRKGPVVHRRSAVRLPAPLEPAGWAKYDLLSFSPTPSANRYKHLFLHFLPALINIAWGEMRFVGVPPRTPDEIGQLQPEWQSLYLGSKVGIINEAYLQFGIDPTTDESYSAEAFYAVTAGLKWDLKLILRYFSALLFPWVKLGSQPTANEDLSKKNGTAD